VLKKKGASCEIEFGKGKSKLFIIVFFDPVEIWVDTKALPPASSICALCDGIPILQSECGEKKPYHKRTFVNMEWVINDWKGPEDLIEVIKSKRDKILEDLPLLREKYANQGVVHGISKDSQP
jgi:hypothetical protein